MTHLYERTTILMRDGVGLAAVLFRPTAGVAATLIVRTPYGHDLPIGGNGGTYPHLLALLDAGYAVCWVECRGTFKSEGRFRPKVDEVDDGYDTIDWLVSQPWSNGEVASYGMSYFGMTQWAMAVSGHPALKAIAPIMTAMDWYKGVWYSPGGALSPAIVAPWHVVVRLNEHIRNPTSHPNSTELVGTLAAGLMSGNELVEHAPLATHPLFAGPKDDEESPLHEILSHAAYDEYWAAQDYTRLVSKIKAPALIVAGWYDIFIAQSVHDFRALRVQGATAAVRDGSRLIVGPWDHANLDLDALYPVRDFGLAATGGVADLTGEHLAHFARHLKPHESQAMAGGMDDNTGGGDEADRSPLAPVKLFIMGIDQWREEEDWPLPDTMYVDYHLTAGSLTRVEPAIDEEYAYVYDPLDPVRTSDAVRTTAVWQPHDQRGRDDRSDVLTFVTEPFQNPLEVTGHVAAALWVSSDAVDTDFTAMLIDVFPDGRAVNLCQGILRMRYREGLTTPELMVPGEVYLAEIDMAVTANVFLPGHRLRLDVSSSNFPRFDRNTNTGGDISSESLEAAVAATNVIYCGPSRPSRITLPVIDRS